MQHELKTVNPYFNHSWMKFKKFELRHNDRNFKEGDILKLKEYDEDQEKFTGRIVYAEITYILEGPVYGLNSDWVILQISNTVNYDGRISDDYQ